MHSLHCKQFNRDSSEISSLPVKCSASLLRTAENSSWRTLIVQKTHETSGNWMQTPVRSVVNKHTLYCMLIKRKKDKCKSFVVKLFVNLFPFVDLSLKSLNNLHVEMWIISLIIVDIVLLFIYRYYVI